MEDLKMIKEIVNFILTMILIVGIILLVFKWKENIEKRSKLYIKESELVDLKKINQEKESEMYDLAFKKGGKK